MYTKDIVLPDGSKSRRRIIDAVGLKRVRTKGKPAYYEMRGIEAKASLADFRSGFCAAPAYTYIIAPLGVIPHELLPKGIGLIEVDLEKFQLKKYCNKIPEMKGVTLSVKARKRVDSRFKSEETYRNWCFRKLHDIAYRCGNELLFWRNYIDFG